MRCRRRHEATEDKTSNPNTSQHRHEIPNIHRHNRNHTIKRQSAHTPKLNGNNNKKHHSVNTHSKYATPPSKQSILAIHAASLALHGLIFALLPIP